MSDVSKVYPSGEGPHTAAIKAASLVVLRDGADGLELLMLKRPPGGNFGDFWVFPGGKVDADDHLEHDVDPLAGYRRAAAREAAEECALAIAADAVVTLSYWEPPPRAGVRFGTGFFAAEHPGTHVTIDGSEIVEYDWIRPRDGHRRRDDGGFSLAPPTWVTLETLAAYPSVGAALAGLGGQVGPPDYRTRLGKVGDEMVAMWHGDAGYEPHDPHVDGNRHRLVMGDSYRFERRG